MRLINRTSKQDYRPDIHSVSLMLVVVCCILLQPQAESLPLQSEVNIYKVLTVNVNSEQVEERHFRPMYVSRIIDDEPVSHMALTEVLCSRGPQSLLSFPYTFMYYSMSSRCIIVIGLN